MGEQPPPVLARLPLATPGNGRRIGRAQPRPIGEISQKVKAHLGCDLAIALGHHHPLDGPCSVHSGSALLGWVLRVSTTAVSLAGRAFSPDRSPSAAQAW